MAHFSAPDRADRLDLLASILRDRPGISAAAVAGELGIGIRSVFRDLERLRDRGYPIESSRGRGGGLRLDPRWGLGRVLLTSEEALCTLLGLAISEQLGFPMFTGEVRRARRKIVDAFPPAARRHIAPLRERVFIGQRASPAVRASYREPAAAILRPLQAAFVEERRIRVVYERPGSAPLERLLEPHAIVINWPAWYLMAFDRTREDMRTFRFDRFVSIERLSERFRPRPREAAAELLNDARTPLATV
jgi:predicted DNA-binding transcriptional regulator YafY